MGFFGLDFIMICGAIDYGYSIVDQRNLRQETPKIAIATALAIAIFLLLRAVGDTPEAQN